MDTVIELKAITKSFGGFHAVESMDLAIQEGEIVSLLGPSGCGKTTTLRMIAGFERPTTGNIFLHGKDIVGVPVRLRNMTMVFQNYALFPHMTVEENIAFGLKVRRQRRDIRQSRVKEMLRLVKLEGFEERLPSQLSGGQQQRVALARALITEPNVVLLDEPFGALDKKLRETMQLEIRNILKSIRATAVFVTHDQEEALVLSDKIVVMNAGRVQQVGNPRQIYEHPATKFTSNFIGVSNIFEGPVCHDEYGKPYIECGCRLFFEGANTGDRATVAVRPERIVLDRHAEQKADNKLAGTVRHQKYFGTMIQMYIEQDETEQMIIVSCVNAGDDARHFEVGDRVGMVFDPAYNISVMDA